MSKQGRVVWSVSGYISSVYQQPGPARFFVPVPFYEQVIDAYTRMLKAKKGEIDAIVTTAEPLTAPQEKALAAGLKAQVRQSLGAWTSSSDAVQVFFVLRRNCKNEAYPVVYFANCSVGATAWFPREGNAWSIDPSHWSEASAFSAERCCRTVTWFVPSAVLEPRSHF